LAERTLVQGNTPNKYALVWAAPCAQLAKTWMPALKPGRRQDGGLRKCEKTRAICCGTGLGELPYGVKNGPSARKRTGPNEKSP
jgi:hypothetical protein